MSDADLDPRGKPADAVLAAELALGVLDRAAQARAEARAASDDAFAADAAGWSRRLASLSETVGAIDPSPELWTRIEATVATTAPASAGEVAAPKSAAPELPPEFRGREVASAPTTVEADAIGRPPARPPALAFWRAAAFAGMTLAAASLVVAATATKGRLAGASPLLTAKLDPAPGAPALVASEPLFVATLDRYRAALLLTPISPGPVDPRARELWLIPRRGRPIAAGMIGGDGGRPLPLSRELVEAAEAGAALSVTLEPRGGSPSGAPTGPVVASGVLARV